MDGRSTLLLRYEMVLVAMHLWWLLGRVDLPRFLHSTMTGPTKECILQTLEWVSVRASSWLWLLYCLCGTWLSDRCNHYRYRCRAWYFLQRRCHLLGIYHIASSTNEKQCIDQWCPAHLKKLTGADVLSRPQSTALPASLLLAWMQVGCLLTRKCACWLTLQGHPEPGIQNVKISLPVRNWLPAKQRSLHHAGIGYISNTLSRQRESLDLCRTHMPNDEN